MHVFRSESSGYYMHHPNKAQLLVQSDRLSLCLSLYCSVTTKLVSLKPDSPGAKAVLLPASFLIGVSDTPGPPNAFRLASCSSHTLPSS